MIRIPSGSFWMGDESSQASSDEKPRHKVTLTKDFFLCDREVTVGQFKEFVAEVADDPKCTDAEKEIAKSWDGEDKNFSPTGDCPVQRVNWFQAVAFCNWLSRREGLPACYSLSKTKPDAEKDWKCDLHAEASGYRLPSEAEWEYACRAVSQTQYAFGDDERLLPEYGYCNNISTRQIWPAGDKLPNGWGLFDMHGNVWEWCWDWFDSAYYRESPDRDPNGPARSDGSSARVLRSGSWDDLAFGLRSAVRSDDHPADAENGTGVRVARALRKP